MSDYFKGERPLLATWLLAFAIAVIAGLLPGLIEKFAGIVLPQSVKFTISVCQALFNWIMLWRCAAKHKDANPIGANATKAAVIIFAANTVYRLFIK